LSPKKIDIQKDIRMKFTAFIPYVPPDQVLAIAKAADISGWDSIALPDCVFHPETVSAKYPYTTDGVRHWTPETPWVDPYVAIPAMAAVTQRLRFFTDVLKAPLRQPLLLAKALGSAESMFPGRIALGVGTSWMPEEFTWLNEDMPSRGARLDEMMEIIRRCLSPGWAEFHGKHYTFEKLVMSPVPAKPVPIYVGGHAAPARRRAARLGDGWIAAYIDAAELKIVIPQMLAERASGPRAGLPFEIITSTMQLPSQDDIKRLADLGVTGLAIRPYAEDAVTADAKCSGVMRYAEEVIQRLRLGNA
jgi:probable F420-dependent oxidoreductase